MTLSFLDALLPSVAVFGLAAIWLVRVKSRVDSVKRLAQLDDAAKLLTLHAETLERFLDDPDAPASLKALLLNVSDAMADRTVAMRMAEWETSRPLGAPVSTPETLELERMLVQLRAKRPDLEQDFSQSVVTAAIGGLLRWPETAAKLERVATRMAAQPKREAAVALAATHLRDGIGFSGGPLPQAAA